MASPFHPPPRPTLPTFNAWPVRPTLPPFNADSDEPTLPPLNADSGEPTLPPFNAWPVRPELPTYAGLNAYQLAVIGAEGVPPFVGTLAEWLLSLHAGTGGSVSLWGGLVSSWTEEPTLNPEAPTLGGEVYDYVFGTTTYYRHVPDPYDPTQDAFYGTYSAGVLGTLVAAKGLAI